MTSLTLTRPDDWHLHVRDGAAMASVIRHTARRFARAVIMPNLKPPVTTTERALAYRQRIMAALPDGANFNPLMTLYLTDDTAPQEIIKATTSPHVLAVKYYPAGATTHSDAGVTDLRNTYATLATMEEQDMPLLMHGEVVDPTVDIFDREKVFIERELMPLIERFPKLRVVFEHVTTREGIDYVRSASDRVAATLTAHHLLINRNALLIGGMRPHHYCLPVPKRESHRQALLAAAISANPKFFLGTDSAPHPQYTKESACACAGIYTAHAAIELYAEAFEQAGALDKLEAFASFAGSDFYRLPRNTQTITLVNDPWQVAREFQLGKDTLVPFRAGERVEWRMAE